LKCAVALGIKLFYSYRCSGTASTAGNWFSKFLRKMGSTKLLLFTCSIHLLFDLKQQKIAINTANYTAAWRNVVLYQECDDSFGCEMRPFQHLVMSCSNRSHWVQKSPYFFKSHDAAPGSLASLFYRVDEIVECSIIVPALLSDCLRNSQRERAYKSALMLVARGDAVRTGHFTREVAPDMV